MFAVWPPPCTEGNKAFGGFTGSLIVKTAGSGRERLAGRHTGDPLEYGEGLGLSTSYPTGSLALARGSNED